MTSFGIRLWTLIFIITTPVIISVSNCLREENGQCRQCSSGYLLDKSSCLKCLDNNCLSCLRPKANSCFQCNDGFSLINGQCGTKCSSIPHCEYCTNNLNQCIYCSNGCQLSNGECSCATRVAIIVVCTILSVIVVGLIIYCLTKTASSRKNKLVQLALNANTNQIEVIDNLDNTHVIYDEQDVREQAQQQQNQQASQGPQKLSELIDKRGKQLTILSDNTSKTNGDEKAMCDYCLVESAIEQLECGCFICTRHHSLVKNEEGKKSECPVCHKEVSVERIRVIKCPLCLNSTDARKSFGCQCGLKICDDCHKNNEGNVKSCPSCLL